MNVFYFQFDCGQNGVCALKVKGQVCVIWYPLYIYCYMSFP